MRHHFAVEPVAATFRAQARHGVTVRELRAHVGVMQDADIVARQAVAVDAVVAWVEVLDQVRPAGEIVRHVVVGATHRAQRVEWRQMGAGALAVP